MEEKHSLVLWRLTLILLAVALLGYGGIYLNSLLHPPRVSVVATSYTYRESVSSAGILVRSESPLSDQRPFTLVTAQSGKRVAAGEKLGISYESAEDLERAERMKSLELEITLAEKALGGAENSENTAERVDKTLSAVFSLSESVARHRSASLRYDALQLRSLLFERGTLLTREEITALKQELARLEREESGSIRELVSPASGVFTPLLDGCESISPAVLEQLSVRSLRTLMEGRPNVDKRCYGKLITDYKWYYAALLRAEDCAALQVGGRVKLDLSAWRAGLCTMTVIRISAESGGERAVLLSSDTALTETLELRTVSCPLVINSVTGIRLPAAALLSGSTSGSYVLVDTGISERRQSVNVLRRVDDWVLVQGVDEGDAIIVP